MAHRGEHARTVDRDVGVQVVVLARHHFAILNVDVDARHLCSLVGEPVHVHAVVAAEGHHLVGILSRFYLLRTVIVGVLRHAPQAEFGEHQVEVALRLHQAQPQVLVAAAQVHLLALVGLARTRGQPVLVGRERADVLPRLAVLRGIERQLQGGVAVVVARGVAEAQAAQFLRQRNLYVGLGVVDGLLLFLRHVPRRVVERVHVAVEHLGPALAVATRQVAREHAGIQFHRRLHILLGFAVPNGILHQHLLVAALAWQRHGVDDVLVELPPALLVQLQLAAYVEACRVVAELHGGRQPLADASHAGRDERVACDVGHHVGIHLVVVFVVELQLHDAGQTIADFGLRAYHHGVYTGVVIAERRVCHGAHAPLSLHVFPVGQHGLGENIQALQSAGIAVVHQQHLSVVGSPTLHSHQRPCQQEQKEYFFHHKRSLQISLKKNSAAKLRISERNAKQKPSFLFHFS